MSGIDTLASKRLHDYMSGISEAAYGVPWIDHLEYVLWHVVVSGPMQYGKLPLDSNHIEQLRQLSDGCGGWLKVDRSGKEQWVPLIEWQDLYTANIDLVTLG